MRNKVLNKVNLILGLLVAFFAGCHSQRHVVKDRGPEAKYGVPQEILDQWERENQAQAADTIAKPEQAPANEVSEEEGEEPYPAPQPKKYGPVPPSRD